MALHVLWLLLVMTEGDDLLNQVLRPLQFTLMETQLHGE